MVSQGAARTQVSQRSRLAKPGAAASCAVMSRLCLPERVEFVQHVKAAILGHLHALCTGNSMWAMKCSSEDCVIDATAVQVAGHPGRFLHRQVVGLSKLHCSKRVLCFADCHPLSPKDSKEESTCNCVSCSAGCSGSPSWPHSAWADISVQGPVPASIVHTAKKLLARQALGPLLH